MIKVQRELLERLLLISLYLERQGFHLQDLLMDSWKGIRLPLGWPRSDALFRHVYNEGLKSGKYTKWEAIHEAVKNALQGADGSTAHHPTLIDILVDVLESPNGRQILSGRNLDTLRKAILLPENMSKLGESLRKEMACANCGHPFMQGEMATCGIEDRNGNGMVFYCQRCSQASRSVCSGLKCEGVVNLDQEALMRVIHKPCSACEDPKKKRAEAPPIDLEAPPEDLGPPPLNYRWIRVNGEWQLHHVMDLPPNVGGLPADPNLPQPDEAPLPPDRVVVRDQNGNGLNRAGQVVERVMPLDRPVAALWNDEPAPAEPEVPGDGWVVVGQAQPPPWREVPPEALDAARAQAQQRELRVLRERWLEEQDRIRQAGQAGRRNQ